MIRLDELVERVHLIDSVLCNKPFDQALDCEMASLSGENALDFALARVFALNNTGSQKFVHAPLTSCKKNCQPLASGVTLISCQL